jgi:hypothetical protein
MSTLLVKLGGITFDQVMTAWIIPLVKFSETRTSPNHADFRGYDIPSPVEASVSSKSYSST